MSLAVGETHGNSVLPSDELPTLQGLNVMGAELVGRIFDPFGVGNLFVGGSLSAGFTRG
jgi:hypothetical protein